ncbi:MAG: Omp28 family outer membrane lipoprotein, partial [Bacteroidales bacterium]|nr:Omp28 family outer membrane lipoprotein [Bacteroidales bacterium]
MKSLNYIIGLLAGMAAMVSFSACNQIKEDERKVDYEGSISSDRYVLLEDFSGAKCPNCPKATGQAHNLTKFYGDNVIVVAYYPQTPAGLTMPYPNNMDLRTEVAQTYATYYAFAQLPSGLVNRTGGAKEYPEWASAVTGFILDATNYARLSGKVWRGEGLDVNVEIEGSFVEDYTQAGEIGILAMVIEDSIVAEQRLPQGGSDAGYVHNHVFRMLFSDVWGDKVLNEKPEKGTEFAQTYRATVSEAWRSEKLSVVAALVNMRSREVI